MRDARPGRRCRGFAWTFVPAGTEKPGRILIDDRFCGIWEPTARQLDTQWYGDFPTYSFTSLAEWLGKWYSSRRQHSPPYDDELLSQLRRAGHQDARGADPRCRERPQSSDSSAAAAGCLLVGDHTNLLGMGTHLNALSAKHGIRFRYDSVSDAADGRIRRSTTARRSAAMSGRCTSSNSSS